MTKQETKEIAKIIAYGEHLGKDYMARALSALYRATRTTKNQNEILALGVAYGLVSNPEWIV